MSLLFYMLLGLGSGNWVYRCSSFYLYHLSFLCVSSTTGVLRRENYIRYSRILDLKFILFYSTGK